MARTGGMTYEIEDRRKRHAGVFGAGEFMVWQVAFQPFPCRLFAGKAATRAGAQDLIRKLKQAAKGGTS